MRIRGSKKLRVFLESGKMPLFPFKNFALKQKATAGTAVLHDRIREICENLWKNKKEFRGFKKTSCISRGDRIVAPSTENFRGFVAP